MAEVGVLLVAGIEPEPVRVVDVRLLVARLGEVRHAQHLWLDVLEVAVLRRKLEIGAVRVPAGRDLVGPVVEVQVVDRTGRLGNELVAMLTACVQHGSALAGIVVARALLRVLAGAGLL